MAGAEDVTAIPLQDIVVCNACCCSITGCSCTYPQCCGCICSGLMCCIMEDCKMCKPLEAGKNEEGKCCLCSEGGCYCIKPTTCIAESCQCCCLDTRCAFPCTKDVPCIFTLLPFCTLCAGYGCNVKCCAPVKNILPEEASQGEVHVGEKGKEKRSSKELSDVQVEDLIVLCGACCAISSCFCKWPNCCGVKLSGLFLCCSGEEACCKPIQEENDQGICCICFEGGCYCVRPSTCCQYQAQCFCIDERCAFPCTKQTPCMFSLLPFCVCCADFKLNVACCSKAGDLVGEKVAPDHATLS